MIEKHWLALYPGAKKNFAATEAFCCNGYLDLHARDPDVAKDLRRVGPVALTWMRSIYFGLGVSASRDCMNTMPESLKSRVMDWFRDIENVETTEECLAAAKRIWADILKDPTDRNDPPANQDAGSPAPPWARCRPRRTGPGPRSGCIQ